MYQAKQASGSCPMLMTAGAACRTFRHQATQLQLLCADLPALAVAICIACTLAHCLSFHCCCCRYQKVLQHPLPTTLCRLRLNFTGVGGLQHGPCTRVLLPQMLQLQELDLKVGDAGAWVVDDGLNLRSSCGF